MNEIKLVLPTKRYKEQIEKYWQTMKIQEFWKMAI